MNRSQMSDLEVPHGTKKPPGPVGGGDETNGFAKRLC